MQTIHPNEDPSNPDDAIEPAAENDRFGSWPELFGAVLVAFVTWIILTQTG